MGPKTALPNSIDIAEGKGKGGWATGLFDESRDRETRLQIEKKKGMREGRDPSPSMKKGDTSYQPFCGDVPRDPGYEQSDGPRGTAWPIG